MLTRFCLLLALLTTPAIAGEVALVLEQNARKRSGYPTRHHS